MDYVVGSVAALITGNVTPNRPKLSKRAMTPVKHMPSPNVTPKSELVDDRSIFQSPTTLKKKAIIKKSPKRIFQNPDLDITNENEGNTSLSSPKADKAKKQLKNDLEANTSLNNGTDSAKSPKKKRSKSAETMSSKKDLINGDIEVKTDDTPSKNKKKKRNSASESKINENECAENVSDTLKQKSPKKNKQNPEANVEEQAGNTAADVAKSPKKRKKKNKKSNNTSTKDSVETIKSGNDGSQENTTDSANSKKKNKKRKKPKKKNNEQNNTEANETTNVVHSDNPPDKTKKMKVNPNAITDKDSDSEHESDNEIESENEETNNEVLDNSAEVEEESSDEEDAPKPKKQKKQKVETTEKPEVENKEVNTEDEIKRTLFVGNVLFSKKCKKEIKKIFNKYGQIESVRIRTVPVKDPRTTPKVALIKEELHPERTTVNVYVKFALESSVAAALAENNTILNERHLRVSRSNSTGSEHDPKCSIFVGNIPFALEDEGLREKFEKCGEIQSVRIVRDKKTNAGKGFGYVNFTSKDGVELALALTDEDLTIKNRILRVKRCTLATNKQAQRKETGMKPNGKNFPDRQFQARGQGSFRGRGGKSFGPGRGGVRPGRSERSQGRNQRERSGDNGKNEGAYRRLMNKRKHQEGGDGDQPVKEKKVRKEFVGMTAEKKKKQKFDKGQKKKKVLSEIFQNK